MPLILIVEDERELAAITEKYLQNAGFDTYIIDNGLAVINWVKASHPDVILLDWMLPGKDGLALCQEISGFSDIPVIMTTAKVDEIDRLIGLEAGADDYICKPYSPKEVVARVKVCLRRLNKLSTADPVTLDPQLLTVTLNGHSITLTLLEFRLFQLLYSHPRRIFSRQQIMDNIYQDYRVVSDKTVNSHIRNLRKKLTELPSDDELIQSVYAVGYRYSGTVQIQ